MTIRSFFAACAGLAAFLCLAGGAAAHSPGSPDSLHSPDAPSLDRAAAEDADAIAPWTPDRPGSGASGAAGPGAETSAKRPYKLRGSRWPGRKIKVVIRAKGATAKVVRAAMKAWNRSGAAIRFVKAKRPGRRTILVTIDRRLDGGKATLGYIPPRGIVAYPGPKRDCKVSQRMSRRKYIRLVKKQCPWARIVTLKKGGGRMWLDEMPSAEVRENFRGYVRLAAHELGHNLGLAHRDTSCLVMNTKPRAGCTHSAKNPVKTICRVPMPGDVKGVVSRYGGRVKVKRAKRNLCDKFPRPGAPRVAAVRAPGGNLALSARAGRLPPPYKRAGQNGRMTVLVSNRPTCPYRKGGNARKAFPVSYTLDSFLMPWTTRGGQLFPRTVPHPGASFPGAKLCIAAYVADRYGRNSRLSAPVPVP